MTCSLVWMGSSFLYAGDAHFQTQATKVYLLTYSCSLKIIISPGEWWIPQNWSLLRFRWIVCWVIMSRLCFCQERSYLVFYDCLYYIGEIVIFVPVWSWGLKNRIIWKYYDQTQPFGDRCEQPKGLSVPCYYHCSRSLCDKCMLEFLYFQLGLSDWKKSKKKKQCYLAIKSIKSFCLVLFQTRPFSLYVCSFPMFL